MTVPQTFFVPNSDNDTTLCTTLYKHQNRDAESIILLHGGMSRRVVQSLAFALSIIIIFFVSFFWFSHEFLFLIPGPGVPDAMEVVTNSLNKKFRVIYFQQRGTGKSTCKNGDYSMDSYISDIEAIADYFDLKQFHLFGHSWGGLYAQIYANEKPERILSLFLSSPSSGTNQLWLDTESEVLAYCQQNSTSFEFLSMGILSLFGILGSNLAYQNLFALVLSVYHRNHNQQHQGSKAIEIDKASLTETIRAEPINKTRPFLQTYKSLPEIVVDPQYPIVISFGQSDIYGQSKMKTMKRFPTAKIFEIEDSGHIPFLHNPSRFFSIVHDFYGI